MHLDVTTSNILITDANYKHSLGILRSLGKKGIKAHVLSKQKKSLCSYSTFCKSELVFDGDLSSSAFIDYVKSFKITQIIPVGVNSFRAMLKLKEHLKQANIHCILPPDDAFQICTSKHQTSEIAQTLKIPTPQIWRLTNASNLDHLQDQVSYPCVFKAEEELGGSIVRYIQSPSQFKQVINDTLSKHSNMSLSHFILQEYLEGDGYGFFAVYNQGACGNTFQHHRRRELPPSGGYSVAAESVIEPKLLQYGKKILDSLNWHGVAMVEFKQNKNGEFFLLEINPKFWGSLDIALEAGVNFPYELVKMANGQDTPFSDEYRYPFKYFWPLNGDFDHLIQNPRSLLSIVKDIFNPNSHSNLWLFTDFRPTLRLWRLFIVSNFKKICRKIT